MGKLLNNKKLYVSSEKKITINNLTIDGAKAGAAVGKVGKNSTVAMDAPEIIINGANCKNTLSCYNIFEQPYSKSSRKINKLVVKNAIIDATNVTHNIVSVYCFEDGANITFSNCEFKLNSNNNPIRFDNLVGAQNLNIVFDNCKWEYIEDASLAGNANYLALILLQVGTAADYEKALFNTWNIEVKNCQYMNTDIEPDLFENYRSLTTMEQTGTVNDGKAILYYYTNELVDPDIKPELFPTVKIVKGSVKKVYNA